MKKHTSSQKKSNNGNVSGKNNKNYNNNIHESNSHNIYNAAAPRIKNEVKKSTAKIDLLDKKILFELDKNARIPTTQLAKKLNISRETCKYRIANLVKNNVIAKFSTIINPNKLGYKMYKIHLQLTNIGEEREKFYDYLSKHTYVYWMGICNGSWDLILTMFVHDANHLYAIINEINYKFRHIIARKVVGTFVDAYVYKN